LEVNLFYLRRMNGNASVNLRSFKQKTRYNKSSFRRFLTRLEKNAPKGIENLTAKLEKEVWKEVDCLSCANCCKTMTPTYTPKDIIRISSHLGMTANEFKKKWLRKERNSGDWLNKTTPCQFLNLKNNKCTIYEVRPADCSGFPHLPKKMKDYVHVHKQNVEYCPATYRLVEKMMQKVSGEW
jgi:Fe-S-cluster containining protein